MGEKKLNDGKLETFKGLAASARLRPFIASIVLHAALLMALFAGGPLFGTSWKQLEVESGSLELILMSSPSQVASSRSQASPARVVKPVPTKPVVTPSSETQPWTQPLTRSADSAADSADSSSDAAAAASSATDGRSDSGRDGEFAKASGANSPEARYLAEIRALLEARKEYPVAARRMGHRGRVVVRFVLERDGRVQKAEIVSGSASEILNRAARGLIDGLRAVKPFPKEVALSEWAVVVPIEYQM